MACAGSLAVSAVLHLVTTWSMVRFMIQHWRLLHHTVCLKM